MANEAKGFVGADLAAGRYQVISELGAGGMALVYLAMDRQESRQVVIKVPRQAMLDDPEFAGRFAREIKSLFRLNHPHIAKILDVGEHEGKPFVVLEYLSGGSLRDRMANGPRPVEELKGWLPGIAAALDFCHQNECVHRDVKPDNILFDAQGKAYLSDFGIAKVMSKSPKTKMTVLTGTGLVLGTAQYMAPELVMGKKYDGMADQYGLAVTVYEVLAAKTPFTGNTPMAVIVEQSTKDVPPLHIVAPGISRQVSGVVGKGLAKDPKDRFPDCQLFSQGILGAVDGAAILAGPPALGIPALLPQKQNPVGQAVSCPKCQHSFRMPFGATGKKVKCPHCQATVRVTGKHKSQPTNTAIQGTPSVQGKNPIPTGILANSRTQPQRSVQKAPWSMREKVLLGLVVLLLAAVPVGCFAIYNLLPVEGNNDHLSLAQVPANEDSALPKDPLPKGPLQPSQKIELLPVDSVILNAGERKSVPVTVKRNGFKGTITVSIKGLPDALKTSPLELAGDEESGNVKLTASPGAESKGDNFKVVAKTGTASDETTISIEIAKPPLPAVLSFSDVQEIALQPQVFKYVEVKLESQNCTKPIQVRLEGLGDRIEHFLNYSAGNVHLNLRLVADGPEEIINGKLVAESGQIRTEKTLAVRLSKPAGVFRWLGQGNNSHIRKLVLSPNGSQVLALAYRFATVWEVKTGKLIWGTEFKGSLRGEGLGLDAAFSPNGKFILTCQEYTGGRSREITLWDVKKKTPLKKFNGNEFGVICLAFSPDGSSFLAGNGGWTIEHCDIENGNVMKVLKGHTNVVCVVRFSSDGKFCFSSGGDGTVRIWDVEKGVEIGRCSGHTESVLALVISPVGKFLLSGSYDKSLRKWEWPSGVLLQKLVQQNIAVNCIAISSDGKMAISNTGSENAVTLWNLSNGAEIRRIKLPSYGTQAAFLPGDDTAIIGCGDGFMYVVEVK